MGQSKAAACLQADQQLNIMLAREEPCCQSGATQSSNFVNKKTVCENRNEHEF